MKEPNFSKNGVGIQKPTSRYFFEPLSTIKKIIPWKLRDLVISSREKPEDDKEKPRKPKEVHYFPLIHLDDGPDAWYYHWDITKNGGMQKFYIKNNGLRTSSLVVVETYETSMGLYQIPLGHPYPETLNARGFIRNLHPGETKTIDLPWNPDTTQPETHFNVAAFDPLLDPKYPLNFHPSQFPDFHIKHNGHAVQREV